MPGDILVPDNDLLGDYASLIYYLNEMDAVWHLGGVDACLIALA